MNLKGILEIVRLTDVGLLREHNEDTVASDDTIGFVVLADGMGGYQAGEVASEMAVLSITAELKETIQDSQPSQVGAVFSQQSEALLILNAVKNANDAIYHASHTQAQCAGMGTTLVLGIFTNNKLLVGHIGDSRMYRLRGQVLSQITEDHSLLQEQIAAGLMTKAQAKYSDNRNLVTRALGVAPVVELTLNEYDVDAHDIYLLCSDGLTDLVDDDAIQTTLNTLASNLTYAAHTLVEMANDNGGNDNISVILVKVNSTFGVQLADKIKHTWVNRFFAWLK